MLKGVGPIIDANIVSALKAKGRGDEVVIRRFPDRLACRRGGRAPCEA